MLTVEFLLFPDNPKTIKCNDNKSLNHLFLSNPAIKIQNNTMTVGKFSAGYKVEAGTFKDQKSVYFHIELSCEKTEEIDQFIELLREAKSIIHLINQKPSVLYDGISLHYSQLAYPKIFEIENLMRKLITKFMLINVGVDWSEQRVPEDVKTSVLSAKKEHTYLHNVDFIQLKNFLFSDNYPNHRNSLIQKLKTAKKIEELDLMEIKMLVPQSNWERFFSGSLNCTQEQLEKKWDALYELRCQIAHNKAFTKGNYQRVDELCSETQKILTDAITKLDTINISEKEGAMITETVVASFSQTNANFVQVWSFLEQAILLTYKCIKSQEDKTVPFGSRPLLEIVNELFNMAQITSWEFELIVYTSNLRSDIALNRADSEKQIRGQLLIDMYDLIDKLTNKQHLILSGQN